MGCCSSQTKTKNPVRQNINPPAPKQSLTRLGENGAKGGPHLQIPNSIGEKVRIDTPMVTEENQRLSARGKAQNLSQSKGFLSVPGVGIGGKQRNYQYFDISPKVVKKNKIYHISNQYPVSKPYSNPSEWQKVISKNQQMTEEELISKVLAMRNRNWIQDQIKIQIETSNQNTGSLESLVTNRRFIQLREHFNWMVWAVAQYYFQQKFENRYNLPKLNTRKWSDGFEFKGVYFRVLPYEDAYFIHNEMQALKYVQMELLELQTLSIPLAQQYGQPKENLQRDVILPLISGITCGGFYLYGTPVIYTQELDTTKEFYKDINASKVGGLQNSIVQGYNSVQQMQAIQNQSNMSFSYLHHNISPDFVQDSMFKFMPILKNITTGNMIPLIDFEEFNEKTNEDHKYDMDLKYLLVHLFDTLPRLSETSASSMLLRFPTFINEDITFHPFPKNNYMELGEIGKLISNDSGIDGDDDESGKETMQFTKKFFTKHGWDFILMQKLGGVNENKRATHFYGQREIPLRQRGAQVSDGMGATSNILFLDEYAPKDDVQEQASRFISPQKQTILKRSDSTSDDKVQGNALVAAYNFKKEFKVKYSLNGHTYSTNIESLYSASLDYVAKIIEQSDNIYNTQSLKELLHRKGLNVRFEWALVAKLRVNQYRDLVMIDILLRTMRRIINEEIKLKSKIQHTHASEGGAQFIDEFYQGNQLDTYKEVLTFYINALLKRKFCKYKQVFDETLMGLFLSRMSILGIVFSLNLRKEEYIYLESKDILEDIIEAPSRNPVMFINAVQTYFKIDFKPEFLRICRQDKHLMLSKSQPLTVNDVKVVGLKPCNYFSIKEQAYFMLARQITHYSKNNQQKIVGKVKTKTEKDKLKQSFQKPKGNESMLSQLQANSSNKRSSNMSGIGPHGMTPNHDSSTMDHQDSKTVRNNDVQQNGKDSLSTIRKYQNINKEMAPYQVEEFNSPALNAAKIDRLSANPTSNKNDSIIDLSRLSKKNNFKPTQIQEIVMPSIMYKLKTFLSSNPMYYFDDQTQTYVGDTFTVLKSYYEMPNIDIVNEWVIILESLLKDVYSVNGSEQVLLEAFVYQALLIYFFENDPESLFKVLAKIRDSLFLISYCSPETITIIQILTGLFFEDQKDQHPIEAEKSYLTALICLFQLYGDPRGRGNIGVPYTLFLSWKLSLLSLSEDKKLQDSEFAEEIFDACLKSLYNHRQLYRDQQLIASLPNNQQKNQNAAEQTIKTTLTKFELEMEAQEVKRQLFDMRKYRSRPQNLTVASGISKSTVYYKSNQKPAQQAKNVYVSNRPSFSIHRSQQASNIKSKSQVPRMRGNRQNEVDPSEIDFEMEDENRTFFIEENFKNAEWYIGTCPFQHWSLYRQQIAQILQAHNSILNRNNQAQSQYQKQIYKDMLKKQLSQDVFYQWIFKFNPLMNQSGVQWSNQQIKEVVFNQNQQMVSSSGSSVILSNQNMSHASFASIPSSAKEKRAQHLGSYSQILGKEAGGISKQDMSGVIFSWGTDSSGQLGLDILNPSNGQTTANLKVLYPRMVVSLRDEIIKEICCGHSHTLVINIHGQVYTWGLNEFGQLGLGPDAPQIVRKPVLNPYLANITRLSAGNEHSLAVTKNGELYVWGAGGLTGLGDMQNRPVPTKMEFFNKTKIQQAVCGGLHTVAVTKDGETYSWGSTEGGQIGLHLTMIQNLCQNKEMPVLTPQRIPKLEGHYVIMIACGEAHSIVMTKEGLIFGWGMSNYGQLGLGFSSDSFEPGIGMEKSKVYEPEEISALKHERIQKIYCGATFSLFMTDKGDLYGCGMNDLGQLGLDTFMEEMQIATLERAKRGKHHQTSDVTLPTKVICFQGITLYNVACGENHALAVSGDDRNMLWAWGMYRNGQLGLGEVTMKMNPRPVQTLCSSLIHKVACGSMHSLALIGDSTQISTYSAQYYASNDVLINFWACDIRGLCTKDPDSDVEYEDEVPDDAEGKVKNPK